MTMKGLVMKGCRELRAQLTPSLHNGKPGMSGRLFVLHQLQMIPL